MNRGIYDQWSCVWQLNISSVVGQREFYCKYAGVGMQSVRFLFSHAWRETGQVTPACGRCSSPLLFAVAAIKMSLCLRREVQQQEAKCSALGPICLWAACKVGRLKTQFPGVVIADVALCQLWWEQVVASVRGLCFLVWVGDWGDRWTACEQWSVTYPCLLMGAAMSRALLQHTPSQTELRNKLYYLYCRNPTHSLTLLMKLCFLVQQCEPRVFTVPCCL